MDKNLSPQKSLSAGKQDKYTTFESELKAVHLYLRSTVATASMVAFSLNIYRPNLSRHKRMLEKQGMLVEIEKGICKATGFPAYYLSCDPEKIQAIKRRLPNG